jgi:two-component system sensor histidine kinase HydH
VLLGSLAWSFASVERAARTVVRGDAQRVSASVEAQLRALGRRPTDADLSAILEAHRGEGARALRIRDPSGLVFAGPARERDAPDPPLGLALEDEDRAVFTAHLSGRPRLHPPPPRPFDDHTSRAPEPLGPPRLSVTLVSATAAELARNARITLGLSVVAAALTALSAMALGRLARERAHKLRRDERERALASLGEMSAVIAHEIRNPLASLKGHAQLLEESLAPESKPRERAGRVLREALRLEALTTDLLAFVRSGALTRRSHDAATFVRAAVEPFGERVRATVLHGPVQLSIDPDRMTEALSNVLRNAQQAAPDSTVELEARADGRAWTCVIRDRGPGVALEDRERIFSPFVTAKTHGTGLGLAIARRIVEAHGGRIPCADAEGGGAAFTVELPVRAASASD